MRNLTDQDIYEEPDRSGYLLGTRQIRIFIRNLTDQDIYEKPDRSGYLLGT
jgi:hypothetical protein